MSRLSAPPNLSIPQNNLNSPTGKESRPRTEYDFNPQFQHPPTTKDKLLQKFHLQPRNIRERKSITPPEISVDATLLLLRESCEGLIALEKEITGLERLKRQIHELTVFAVDIGYFGNKNIRFGTILAYGYPKRTSSCQNTSYSTL
jgi:hypothetical protein